jgi:hypothetical protein
MAALALVDRAVAPNPSGAAVFDEEVRAVLRHMRSGIAQQSLERVVPASLTPAQCQRELAPILAAPGDPLFVPAVLLTEHLHIVALAPVLRTALPLPDPELDSLVVRVLDKLTPLTDNDLHELMACEAPAIKTAALKAFAQRSQTPIPMLADALCDDDAELRAASLATMPPAPPPELTDALARNLETLPPDRAIEGIAALALCPWTERGGSVLLQRLREDGDICDQTLLTLARLARPLDQPATVLAIAQDGARPLLTRARAVWCIERTNTVVAPEALTSLWPEHPVLDYFAARVLLAANRPAGAQLLARILRHAEDDDPEVEAARLGARHLFAELTDTSLYADPATWLQWADSQPALAVGVLPPSAIDLGLPGPPAAPTEDGR